MSLRKRISGLPLPASSTRFSHRAAIAMRCGATGVTYSSYPRRALTSTRVGRGISGWHLEVLAKRVAGNARWAAVEAERVTHHRPWAVCAHDDASAQDSSLGALERDTASFSSRARTTVPRSMMTPCSAARLRSASSNARRRTPRRRPRSRQVL